MIGMIDKMLSQTGETTSRMNGISLAIFKFYELDFRGMEIDFQLKKGLMCHSFTALTLTQREMRNLSIEQCLDVLMRAREGLYPNSHNQLNASECVCLPKLCGSAASELEL